MSLSYLWSSLESDLDAECIVHRDEVRTRRDLLAARDRWVERLEQDGAHGSHSAGGQVVGIESGFHFEAIALLLAVWKVGSVAALIAPGMPDREARLRVGRARSTWHFGDDGEMALRRVEPPHEPDHPLLARLRSEGRSGFIIFSSGSSGAPKAVLHDAGRFLGKFEDADKPLRTLAFLLFDHIAGIDTLCYTLASGGTLVLPEGRDPHSVCRVTERDRVEVLPVSPTFLNLMLVSGAREAYDLSSVKIVTYGSEPMGQTTLDRAREVMPSARFIQKYGTSEFGAPRARSRDDGSLWLQFKPDETEVRVVDDILWIRSPGAMLGYLTEDAPFDGEGWLCTGDLVERDGDWLRILGRESDLINVGGEKVTPAEVEAVIEELGWVAEVEVHGEPHPLTGSIVVASVRLRGGGEDVGHGPAEGAGEEAFEAGTAGAEDRAPDATAGPRDDRELRLAVRRHCRGRLPAHKVPQKVVRVEGPLATDRQKKRRGAGMEGSRGPGR